MRRVGSIVLLWALLGSSVGCESGSASEQIEDFDAAREFRTLKHQRDIDFAWVNPRMQHVVVVTIPLRREYGRGRTEVCTGVLVGEDLVLTGAHCVSRTEYVDPSCIGRARAEEGRPTWGNVTLDVQQVQGSTAGTDLSGPAPTPRGPRFRATRLVGITEMVAWADLAFARVDPSDLTSSCDQNRRRPGLDAVILRLAEPVGLERGYARMRAELPAVGAISPVIHQPGGEAKQITVLRVLDRDALIGSGVLRDGILTSDVPVVPAMDATAPGSSGAPLLDLDGYVLGTLSQGCNDVSEVPPCAVFSNLSVLLGLPRFAAIARAIERPSDSGLGRFDAPGLMDFRLEPAPPLAGIDRPLGLTARPEGGWLTAGFSTDDSERFFALVGYDASGALDPAFGSGGVATEDVSLSSNEQLYDIVYASVAGAQLPFAAGSVAEPESMALARFTADGALDASFATGGVLRINGGPPGAPAPTSGAAIAVDSRDGTLVVAGHASIERAGSGGGLQGSPVVMRFDTAGNPDARCNNGTVFTWRPTARPLFGPGPPAEDPGATLVEMLTAPSWDMVVTDVAIDGSGRAVVVGYLHSGDGSARVPWLGRLNEDCAEDESFGSGDSGVVILSTSFATDPDPQNAWLSAVVIEPSTGRIFVGGTVTAFDPALGFFTGRMFVAALLPDGTPDLAFGAGGAQGGMALRAEGWHDELRGLTYMPSVDGDEARLVLAGESYRDEGRTTRRVRVASFLTDGSPANVAWPANPPASGVFDAWATGVAVSAEGQVFVSVAPRSGSPGP